MAEVQRTFRVRRIVVAADGSTHGRAALRAAAKLGARLHAEVEGVFVEDINLVYLAELPLGREVHPISGEARRLDRGTLEGQLRAQAAEARRELKAQADRVRVRSTFRVVRGRVETEVISAAGEGDLLVLGTFGRSIGPRRRAGSTALAAAERAPRSVLLLRPGATVTGKPLAAYDGTAGAALALEAAARLAGGDGGTVTVLIAADTPDRADELQSRAERFLETRGVKPRILRAPKLELDEMCRRTRDSGADVLVLAADSPVLADKAHARLLEQIGCPILLVR
jgi:nucleotide-binding universal stress UspA family protein